METLTIWTNIGQWLLDQGYLIIVGIVGTFAAKKGWTILIDKFSKKATVITKELGEAFMSASDVFQKLDDMIRDDGTLVENSTKDVWKAGKILVAETKDVVISIKPKPVVAETTTTEADAEVKNETKENLPISAESAKKRRRYKHR